MVKLKMPSFDEGTLLQRTLLHLVTFVLGSVGFVTLASFLVVGVARALVPARTGDTIGADNPTEVAEVSPDKRTGRTARPRRPKGLRANAGEPRPEAEQ